MFTKVLKVTNGSYQGYTDVQLSMKVSRNAPWDSKLLSVSIKKVPNTLKSSASYLLACTVLL